MGILYTYNLAGGMMEKREPVKIEETEVFYRLTTYEYDRNGNLIKEKLEEGIRREKHYFYSDSGRLQRIPETV